MPSAKIACVAVVAALSVTASLVTGCSAGSANPNATGSPGPSGRTATVRTATVRTTTVRTTTVRTTTVRTTTVAADPSAVDPDARLPLIDHVHWGATTKGPQLQVFPTHAGRTDQFPAASRRAWAEVLADTPRARTAGMYDQFLCHWNFARVVEPNKPSWDLEPWRPDVGYAATVAAACNPGGSEG